MGMFSWFNTKVIFGILLWFTDQTSTPAPTSSASTKEVISPAGKQTSLPTSLRTSLSSIRLPASTPMPSTRKPTLSSRPVVHYVGTKPGNTWMANGCVCIDEETLTHYIHDSCIQFWALYSSNIVPNIICTFCTRHLLVTCSKDCRIDTFNVARGVTLRLHQETWEICLTKARIQPTDIRDKIQKRLMDNAPSKHTFIQGNNYEKFAISCVFSAILSHAHYNDIITSHISANKTVCELLCLKRLLH